MRQLPGHLPRWRAVRLLAGRPAVLIPAAAVVAIMASPDGWVRPDVVLLLVIAALIWYLATRGTPITPRRHPDLAALVATTAAAVGSPAP
ncbi:MAG TPA: hypothetical protein VHA75_04660, partial [Rugosimonospora sp.]|nr:hypothetical protein [Rugosimonospora sp.]